MKSYTITCHGCDDSTTIRLDLTDDEAEVVRRVAKAITEASEYSCMPTMSIDAGNEETKETDR